MKNKLTGYVHHEIPKIERYANQQEWVEATLEEELIEEEIIEKAIKSLEKSVEFESFGQVFFTLPPDLEASTSSTTTSVHPTQESHPPAETSKEKELQHP